jgi:hypothetical protein
MNDRRSQPGLLEEIALAIQAFRRDGRIPSEPALLRIDNRSEAARAPFRLDIARGVLHRTGCPAIPTDSQSALYAVWQPGAEDLRSACKQCRPVAPRGTMKQDDGTDIVFGFLSVLDQFSSVLVERGKEYRSSARGQELQAVLAGLLSGLEAQQREALDVVIASLDVVLRSLQSVAAGLDGTGNGHGPSSAAPPGAGRTKPRKEPRRKAPKKP